MRELRISFGAMGEPLIDQIEKQGFTLSELDNERFQRLIVAVNMVHIHGLFPDSACNTARKRLLKQIIEKIIPLESDETDTKR